MTNNDNGVKIIQLLICRRWLSGVMALDEKAGNAEGLIVLAGVGINRAGRNNIFGRLHLPLRSAPWFFLSLGMFAFVAGIIPDIDHVMAWLLDLDNGRFLHPYFDLVGTWLVYFGSVLAGALLGGYAIIRVLSRRDRKSLIPGNDKRIS